jgi:hypothetical protein
LRDQTGNISPLSQGITCIKCHPVLRVPHLNHPAKNVRIKKDVHTRSG